jgi:maltooligosyltrehalose trehalohydrolase
MNNFPQLLSYKYESFPVGSFYNSNSDTEFIVWAPLRKAVSLVLTDHPSQSDRQSAEHPSAVHPMQQDDFGYWKLTLTGTFPGMPYRFRLDNELEWPDPAALAQPGGLLQAGDPLQPPDHPGGHPAPSRIVDRDFHWTDQHWKGLALRDCVIYELHTGTFTSGHDFDGVISRLDYLRDLGINAIEVMPVSQFPGSRNWGYDGMHPYAVQDSYGGVEGLKRLVDAAHSRGIAVILDVVYNHVGPEGYFLKDFGPYFTDKYKTPWGQALNYDDAWCDGVRNYITQNALMWLDEFHIDGLRLDAVHAIYDLSAHHIMRALKEKVSALQAASGRKKFLIAEIDLNDPKYIKPPAKGGYALDGQWVDEFHHALHGLLTGERSGYYVDFGSIAHLEKAFRDSYVYNGNYSSHRKKIFGAAAEDNDYGQFVVFTQNHDQTGNRLLGERLSTLLDFERLKLAASAMLLSPYIPMLFMGEEYGETNPFLFFTDHHDPELIKAVREGRRREFAYFNFTGDFPDPQSHEIFDRSVLSWDMDGPGRKILLALYRSLIAFRAARPAMQSRQRSSMIVHSAVQGSIIAIERFNDDDHLLILLNTGDQQSCYANPSPSSFCKIFDSASAGWGGPGVMLPDVLEPGACAKLYPASAVIFEQTGKT